MAGRRIVYGGAPTSVSASEGCSNPNSILLQNPRVPCSSEPIDSLILAGASPSFLGSRSMVCFEDVNRGKRSDRPFFCSFDQDENVDEEMDEYFHQPEKKRRLLPDQVQFLERSFEVDNKLEPERKIQLAKDLGLQPRQVAIWFQNRRARWKTKQLEKDYSALESCYNSLKADYDGLLKEKEKLKSEVLLLTDKLRLKQKQEGNSEQLDSNNQQSQPPVQTPMDSLVGCCKQEELSSAKSDVLDSDSPCYIDGGHSALLEPGDSSYALEPDQSDLSQDEEDNLSKNLLPPPEYVFPKIEDCDYPTNPPANSCYFSFPVDDQTFGFWSD